jgi:FtsH-binding integral membrane protein
VIDQPVLEHGSTRSGRWLRRQRTTIALVIAVVEAILLLFGAINRPLAIVVAVAVILLYLWIGRRLRPPIAHDIAWIAAVSQGLVALVPLLLFVLTAVAVVAVAILAVVALIVLFSRR